jgi:hypothetical protein
MESGELPLIDIPGDAPVSPDLFGKLIEPSHKDRKKISKLTINRNHF